jgi:hypothetical protein
LCEKSSDFDEVLFVGHSLGGAVATIATAYYGSMATPRVKNVEMFPTALTRIDDGGDGRIEEWIEPSKYTSDDKPSLSNTVAEEWLIDKSIVCHTFGAPRVGNKAFARLLSRIYKDIERYRHHTEEGERIRSSPKSWRVFDESDPIPVFPINPEYVHAFDRALKILSLDGKHEYDNRDNRCNSRYNREGDVSIVTDDPTGETIHQRICYFLTKTSFRSFFSLKLLEILEGHSLNMYIERLERSCFSSSSPYK